MNENMNIKNDYFGTLLPLFYGGRIIPESAIKLYNSATDATPVDLDSHINHSLTVQPSDISINGTSCKLDKKLIDVYGTAFYYLVSARTKDKYSEQHDPLKIELLSLLDSYLTLAGVVHADPIPSKIEKQNIYDIDISYEGTLVGVVLPMTLDHLVTLVISKKRFSLPLIIVACNEEDAKLYKEKLSIYTTLKTHKNIKIIQLSELVRDIDKIQRILKFITAK